MGVASSFKTDMLKGQAAVITGGGTGIGLATATALARHGASIVLAARNAERLEEAASGLRALGGKAIAVPTDVTDIKQVKAAIDTAVREFGRLDIMVNNAAANFIRPSASLTSVRWRKVIDIVLNGSFHGCLEAGKVMLKQGSGSIINMVATYAWTGAPGLAPSAAAKGGVVALTKSLGVEWAAEGVRVNAVAPGFIDTPQSRERLWPDPKMVAKMLASVPAGRFGDPDDAANLVLYLASPMGAYISGEVLTADGGQCLGKGALEMMGELKAVRKGRGAA
jgi:NAD(P)-dependent dehydrogenase (short-subunit alcohol dehydrogenase family)